ncbi:L-lysine 6-transaminase [Candidatus Kapaibacterium sp.]
MNNSINSYLPKYYVPAENVIQELGKYMLADGFDFVLDLYESNGSYFMDARNQKKYLDFFTCFASMPIGMNHPKLLQDDFIQYIGKTSINKPSNSDVYSSEMATFVKTFFETAVPKSFKYSFFISGGALAVENALKSAFDWKVKMNFKKGYNVEKGHKIIHFEEAFHGRSGYTMSLTNTDPKKVKYFPKFDWPRISNPKLNFPITDQVLEDVIKREKVSIAQIKQAFFDNKDDIAGIIIEPIQGEGGDNHFRNEFLKELRYLADENEALLIFDEVQTGVGLTGTMWAHEQLEVTPDIMSFGKKMQICGIISTDRIDTVENNVFHESSRINSTWGGNLVDMVRATKYLEIISEEKLVENAKGQGQYLSSKLHKLQSEFSDEFTNVRGRGLFAAIDFTDATKREKFIKECWKENLMILPCGKNSVRFRPALNINSAQIDDGIEIIRKVMKNIS